MPNHINIIPSGVTRWGGSVIHTAHGCALWEHFTGKSYSYRVVDNKTGTATYICHKPKPVSKSGREAMIVRFLAKKDAASGSGLRLDSSRDTKVSAEQLMESLIYIFKELLPLHGYCLRSEQLELAKDILEALRRRAISLSEAGVGIGKTHAYLIAAALIKRAAVNDFWLRASYPGIAHITELPIVIATSSIALQKAIAKDYIPEISKILLEGGIISKPLDCVVRKGREHYICDKRLHLLWKQSTNSGDKQLLEPLIQGKYGIDLDEMDFIKPFVKRRINVNSRCGKNCGYPDCRYKASLRDGQSDKYDFQICNHNYLLADVLHRSKGQKPLIPHYQAVVIDEAHKFLTAARSMYGLALSNRSLPRIAKTIRQFVFLQGQSTTELWRDADKLDGQARRLFRILSENAPGIYENDEAERFKTKIDGKAERHLRNLREILDRLGERLTERQVLQKYESLYAHTLWELGNLRKLIASFEKHGELIYWLESPDSLLDRDGSGDALLCAIPKRLGDMLHDDLWSKGVPIILTSGTLSAAGDFTHIKRSMGLNAPSLRLLMESSRASPFNYRDNALIYISEDVPFPDIKDTRYINAVADETEKLICAAHGHTAVLFTSYHAMELVFEKLKRRGLPFPLFMMSRGRINAIESFRQSGNGVLFAAGSVWEGIDFPGDILSMLVIVKLPFSAPDPITEHQQAQYKSEGQFKNAVVIPEMLVKLLQGFGRLIRTMSDTGIVAILDSRVRNDGAYRDIVLRALPRCRVTRFITDVINFILSIKPSGYFK